MADFDPIMAGLDITGYGGAEEWELSIYDENIYLSQKEKSRLIKRKKLSQIRQNRYRIGYSVVYSCCE